MKVDQRDDVKSEGVRLRETVSNLQQQVQSLQAEKYGLQKTVSGKKNFDNNLLSIFQCKMLEGELIAARDQNKRCSSCSNNRYDYRSNGNNNAGEDLRAQIDALRYEVREFLHYFYGYK